MGDRARAAAVLVAAVAAPVAGAFGASGAAAVAAVTVRVALVRRPVGGAPSSPAAAFG